MNSLSSIQQATKSSEASVSAVQERNSLFLYAQRISSASESCKKEISLGQFSGQLDEVIGELRKDIFSSSTLHSAIQKTTRSLQARIKSSSDSRIQKIYTYLVEKIDPIGVYKGDLYGKLKAYEDRIQDLEVKGTIQSCIRSVSRSEQKTVEGIQAGFVGIVSQESAKHQGLRQIIWGNSPSFLSKQANTTSSSNHAGGLSFSSPMSSYAPVVPSLQEAKKQGMKLPESRLRQLSLLLMYTQFIYHRIGASAWTSSLSLDRCHKVEKVRDALFKEVLYSLDCISAFQRAKTLLKININNSDDEQIRQIYEGFLREIEWNPLSNSKKRTGDGVSDSTPSRPLSKRKTDVASSSSAADVASSSSVADVASSSSVADVASSSSVESFFASNTPVDTSSSVSSFSGTSSSFLPSPLPLLSPLVQSEVESFFTSHTLVGTSSSVSSFSDNPLTPPPSFDFAATPRPLSPLPSLFSTDLSASSLLLNDIFTTENTSSSLLLSGTDFSLL